jgi:hypothetical protein
LDQAEIDKQIDDALKPKEGEDPLDEESAQHLAKKLRL